MLLVKPTILIQEIRKHEQSTKPGVIELSVCSFKKQKLSEGIESVDEDDKSGSNEELNGIVHKDQESTLRSRYRNGGEKDSQLDDSEEDIYFANDNKRDEICEKLVIATEGYGSKKSYNSQEI